MFIKLYAGTVPGVDRAVTIEYKRREGDRGGSDFREGKPL